MASLGFARMQRALAAWKALSAPSSLPSEKSNAFSTESSHQASSRPLAEDTVLSEMQTVTVQRHNSSDVHQVQQSPSKTVSMQVPCVKKSSVCLSDPQDTIINLFPQHALFDGQYLDRFFEVKESSQTTLDFTYKSLTPISSKANVGNHQKTAEKLTSDTSHVYCRNRDLGGTVPYQSNAFSGHDFSGFCGPSKIFQRKSDTLLSMPVSLCTSPSGPGRGSPGKPDPEPSGPSIDQLKSAMDNLTEMVSDCIQSI